MPNQRFSKLDTKKQEAIYKIALMEFAKHGYNGASLTRIMKEVQMSKGSLYYYFENKEDLFLSLYQRERAKGLMHFKELFEKNKKKDEFWEMFGRILRKQFQWASKTPEVIAMRRCMAELSYATLEVETVRAIKADSIKYFQLFIESGQERNAIRRDIPLELLAYLMDQFRELILSYYQTFRNQSGNRALNKMQVITVDLFKRLFQP